MKALGSRITKVEDFIRYKDMEKNQIVVWDMDEEFFEYRGKLYRTDETLRDKLMADYPNAHVLIVHWV